MSILRTATVLALGAAAAACQQTSGSDEPSRADKPAPRLAGVPSAYAGPGEAASKSSSESAAQGDGEVVARWVAGGEEQTLTLAELQEARKAAFRRIEQEAYEATKRELDQYLVEQLLEAEAEKQGLNTQQLMQKLAKEVSEADVKAFYEGTVAPKGKGPPLAQVEGRIRTYLAMSKRIPQLKKAAKLKVSLPEPSKVEFDLSGRPSMGAKDPKVTIVEFSDFQCPYCARAIEPVKALVEAFPDQVAVYFLHFPLSFHEQAMPAAKAAVCAQKQGKFWPMHDKIFEKQSAMSDSDLASYARGLELDMKAWDACMADPKTEAFVKADMAQGTDAGVSGTPSFYVNGTPHQGPPQVAEIKALLEG